MGKTFSLLVEIGPKLLLLNHAPQVLVGVSAVVCPQFVEKACDVPFHGLFRDRKLCGESLLNSIPIYTYR